MLEHSKQRRLVLRVEEASLNAWPALHQQLYDGWLLRFSRGFTKRANSITPLYQPHSQTADELSLAAKIRYCENLYAQVDQPTVFRLTSLPGQRPLEQALIDRGYEHAGLSQVLLMDLQLLKPEAPAAAGRSALLPSLEQWLAQYCALTALPAPAKSLHQAILKGIHGQLALAVRNSPEHECVSCGLGVLEAELVGLFDVFCAERARRQGQGQRLVWDLLHWGQQAGARFAYLQVAADNLPALRLYQGLGFEELYRYWYRISQ